MPWKFILFLVICILFTIFFTFNTDNRADINFLFAQVQQAPVFLIILISFFAGASVGLLASIFKKSKKRKKEKLEERKRKEAPSDQDHPGGEEPVAPARGRGRKRK